MISCYGGTRFYQILHRYTTTSRLLDFPAFFSTSVIREAKKKMPPKKSAPERKVLLGRPGNNLKIGIVGLFAKSMSFRNSLHLCLKGLPNVGKSSFFNVLSETGVFITSGIFCPISFITILF